VPSPLPVLHVERTPTHVTIATSVGRATDSPASEARPDTGSALPLSRREDRVPSNAHAHLPRSTLELSPRLLAPGRARVPWYSTRAFRSISSPPEPPSATERDSTLVDLHAALPDLAAARAPTPSERDAAAKEALLKMHNTGRLLLVPPDNTGGLISSSIPLPLLGAAPSHARRVRDIRAYDEGRARIERLRARADSMIRARTDSAKDQR